MVTDLTKRIAKLEDENRKLRSMCKAAAAEIAEFWDAHCDDEGYGPVNLMARLEGRLPPDLYAFSGNQKDCEKAAQGASREVSSKGYVRGRKSD